MIASSLAIMPMALLIEAPVRLGGCHRTTAALML
jgi:hypothetical protein